MTELDLVKASLLRYISFNEDELNQMGKFIKFRRFQKNETLHSAGQQCNSLFLLLSGIAKHTFMYGQVTSTIWLSFPGDFVTEIQSFFGRTPSGLNLVALTDVNAAVIDYGDLQFLYSTSKSWERLGRISSESYLLRQMERNLELQFFSAEQRYQKLIKTYPPILQETTLGEIASYLGVTQEHLSRIRAKTPVVN